MKKTILFLLLLFPLWGFTQESFEIYKVAFGPINNEKVKYKTKKITMDVIVDSNVISLTDVADSRYILSNHCMIVNDTKIKLFSYDAVDEDSSRCSVFLEENKRKKESYLIVMYQDYIFKYFYKKKQQQS